MRLARPTSLRAWSARGGSPGSPPRTPVLSRYCRQWVRRESPRAEHAATLSIVNQPNGQPVLDASCGVAHLELRHHPSRHCRRKAAEFHHRSPTNRGGGVSVDHRQPICASSTDSGSCWLSAAVRVVRPSVSSGTAVRATARMVRELGHLCQREYLAHEHATTCAQKCHHFGGPRPRPAGRVAKRDQSPPARAGGPPAHRESSHDTLAVKRQRHGRRVPLAPASVGGRHDSRAYQN